MQQSTNVPNIIVVGSSNMDLIAYTPQLPKRGETLRGYKFRTGCGGKGANQCVMAALLGANVTMVCKLGTDVFGVEMKKNFESHNVNTNFIFTTDKASSGVALISVADDGANSIVIVSGANDLLTKEEIHSAEKVIATSNVMLTQLEIPLELTLEALKLAKKYHIPTILNPAPAQVLPDEIFTYTDILCPNETELELLSQKSITNVKEAEIAAKLLLQRGVKNVIVTLGENGSLLVNEKETFHAPIEEKVKVVDTTGAGDCYLGSFAYFYALGKDIKDCMKRANKIASVSVQFPGTQTSFPKRHQLPQSLFQ